MVLNGDIIGSKPKVRNAVRNIVKIIGSANAMNINQMSFHRNEEDRPPLPNSEKKNWQIKMLAKNQKESSIDEEEATPKGKNLRIQLQPL